ncbi:MAG: LysM peptidoglycan-binding domain-containing protein [Proteobacteria bacterium]|nr:LysM peptidoglycan-binding domain-containing protein [Pseudomonadota bacterium]
MYQTKWIANISGIIVFLFFGFLSTGWAQDSGFYYTIQKGDTLWDLSQRFYNSQWDWPGLWEMNKDIKNPHQIVPGTKIRVFLKSEIPPNPAKEEITETQGPKITPSFAYSQMDHIGFIRKTAESSLGNILREKDGNLMMSVDDIIYIKPTGSGNLIPGKRYQIFTTEAIKETINGQVFKGVKHLIKAELKVLEHNVSYVTAVITKSFRDANVDDRIMAYYERPALLSVQENPAPIDAAIICSEDNTIMVNDYKIAFINKGKLDNIIPGQIYSVLQENKSALGASDSIWPPKTVPLAPLNSGKLIVLHTEDMASTVMILSSKKDIYPGDMVN